MGRAMKLKDATDSRPGSSPRPAPDTAITAVVFDLGGVLLEWNPRHLYRKLFGEDVKGMERFLAEVVSPEWNERQDAGRSWDEAIAEAIASHPEHAALIRAYRERWEEMLGEALTDSVAILDDDTLKNVEAASLLGFRTIHFCNALQLRRDLASLGLLPARDRKSFV